MQILYLMNVTPFCEESVLQAALPLVEQRRRERIMQSKDNKNRALSLAAGVLLSYAVNRWKIDSKRALSCMIQTEVSQVLADLSEAATKKTLCIPQTIIVANGKPYLKDCPDIYFNLSHSGEYAVCVIADCEIGVDIQQYRKNIKEGILKKVLHESEKALYEACGEEKEAFFYHIWAAKEAYAKYTGEGLAVDFRLLCTDLTKREITDTRTDRKYELQIWEGIPNYAITVVKAVEII